MLDFTLHRLAGAERALDSMDAYAVPPGRIERAEMIAMRGDIAFYRGRYAEALAAYAEADVIAPGSADFRRAVRSEEHTSELQSLIRISYAVFCLNKKKS